jgi:hypothetical protein
LRVKLAREFPDVTIGTFDVTYNESEQALPKSKNLRLALHKKDDKKAIIYDKEKTFEQISTWLKQQLGMRG